MSHLEILESELRSFHLDVPASQKLTLSRYCDELVRWNEKINLTGLEGGNMVRRLVVEPVWIAHHLSPSGVLVDIGSGNGSPAIPIHVVRPLQQAHLIEARMKRAAFLRHVVSLLGLSNMTVHRARFEDVGAARIGRTDWITLQAVALGTELIDSIRAKSHKTTNVVWITSSLVQPLLRPKCVLEVPLTGSKVFLFQLDLS